MNFINPPQFQLHDEDYLTRKLTELMKLEGTTTGLSEDGCQAQKNCAGVDEIHTQNEQYYGIFKDIQSLGTKHSPKDGCLAPVKDDLFSV